MCVCVLGAGSGDGMLVTRGGANVENSIVIRGLLLEWNERQDRFSNIIHNSSHTSNISLLQITFTYILYNLFCKTLGCRQCHYFYPHFFRWVIKAHTCLRPFAAGIWHLLFWLPVYYSLYFCFVEVGPDCGRSRKPRREVWAWFLSPSLELTITLKRISNDHGFITTPKKTSHWAIAEGPGWGPIHCTGLMAICVSGLVGQVREWLNP